MNLLGIHNLSSLATARRLTESSRAIARSLERLSSGKRVDADIALEVAELTRQQILQSTQTAVLAQANLQLNLVLEPLAPLKV